MTALVDLATLQFRDPTLVARKAALALQGLPPPSVAPFSPVDLMVGIWAAALAGDGINEVPTSYPANLTIGVGFVVSEPGHTCSGARGLWAGAATSIRLRLWAQLTIPGSVATVDQPVGAAQGLYSGAWAPLALRPGVIYVVSAWDTAGLQTTAFGNAGASPTNRAFGNIAAFAAAPWLTYCLPPVTGGGGENSPFALQQNAPDANPGNISAGAYSPLEPILT